MLMPKHTKGLSYQ